MTSQAPRPEPAASSAAPPIWAPTGLSPTPAAGSQLEFHGTRGSVAVDFLCLACQEHVSLPLRRLLSLEMGAHAPGTWSFALTCADWKRPGKGDQTWRCSSRSDTQGPST